MPPELEGDSQNSPEPQYVTADQIGTIVNAAVTSHLKRSLGSAIDTALKPVLEKLAATAPPPAPPPDDDDKSKRVKQTPELLAAMKKVEEMEKALQAERDRVTAAEKKARDERAFTELRSSLEGKVRPELLDIVAKHLFLVDNRVDFDEAGTPLFKSHRAPYIGGEPEEVRLPLRDGVADFLKSDTAKAFLPAPNPGAGSNPLPKRGPTPSPTGIDFSKPANSDEEKARRALERERMATERLKQQQR